MIKQCYLIVVRGNVGAFDILKTVLTLMCSLKSVSPPWYGQ